MSERERDGDEKPKANIAPDAVKDPNEKTEGKPGAGPQDQHDETDPGGG